MRYIILMLVPFLLAFVTVPLSMIISKRFNIIDVPDMRKVHKEAKPRFGGLGIYLAFIIPSLFMLEMNIANIVILACGTVIYILGALDDIFTLSAKLRFIVESIIALIIVLFGMRFSLFSSMPQLSAMIGQGLDSVVTMIWIIGITNSINLIDGLDGLSSGLVLISSVLLLMFSIFTPVFSLNPMLLIFIGAITAFLIFNFYPSKTFMGDGGSLLLGYLISILCVVSNSDNSLTHIMSSILVLAVPILDTLIAIIRRSMKGIHIFTPDKNHIHHVILDKGFSQRQSVIMIWAMGFALGSLSLVFGLVPDPVAVLLFVCAIIASLILAIRNGMMNMDDFPDSDYNELTKELPINSGIAITKED